MAETAKLAATKWSRMSDQASDALFRKTLDQVIDRTLVNIDRFDGQFPYVGQGNRYELTDNSTWVSGYWTAWLWMMYHQTGDTRFKEATDSHYEGYNRRFNKLYIHCHDIGVIYDMAAVRGYAVTGERKWRHLGLRAAAVLSTRFNESGNFLQAWGYPGEKNENAGRTLIDSLCCTPLWYWATVDSGDEYYAELGRRQTETVINRLVRPDNSSGHTFLFDPETGDPIGIKTRQGYADNSTWSRGQAWGIQGLPVAYAYTGDERFLSTALNMLTWFVDHCGERIIPPWDFNVPDEERDTSALALAANGMLRLSEMKGVDQDTKDACRSLARHAMAALILEHGTFDDPDAWGLLRDGVYAKPLLKDRGNGEFMIWGDYYFVENLMILVGRNPLELEAYNN